MKKLILLIVIITLSCQNNDKDSSCLELEKKYDSILQLRERETSEAFYRFNEIYKKEKKSLKDTALIIEYQSILGVDEVVDFYTHTRINTIAQKKKGEEILKDFIGKHNLKPRYSDYDRYVTSVKITNDSCFVFKDKVLKAADEIQLIYSRNDMTPGIFNIDNYQIKLVKPNIILLRDKVCLHCSSLEFRKVL
jgi:hypothetical protein